MTAVLEPVALVARLQAGEAVLFPTDTLVALAALPEHAGQIWQLKQRPPDKPLILMGADLAQLQLLSGVHWPAQALQLAAQHWPGAVTLVLPAAGPLVEQLNPGGGNSLGLRVPRCPMAQVLLRLSGPLATTSANRSGEPAATTAAEAEACFGAQGVPLLGPLPWPAPGGQASTVLAWQQGGWQLLRAGAVAVDLGALENLC